MPAACNNNNNNTNYQKFTNSTHKNKSSVNKAKKFYRELEENTLAKINTDAYLQFFTNFGEYVDLFINEGEINTLNKNLTTIQQRRNLHKIAMYQRQMDQLFEAHNNARQMQANLETMRDNLY